MSLPVAATTHPTAGSGSSGDLTGNIRIDGSSTVGPLTSAVAEGFMADNPDVKISVGTSGTGGGFEKFCAGETHANDASPSDREETKRSAAKEGRHRCEEITVASDALTVVTNPENPVKCMTVEQLKQVWEPKSTVSSWSDITGLDPAYDEELQLFGPGTDSGTFDYFTEAINGEEGASRTDYNNVGEDDNQTVTGVAGSPGGMGYFGYSFFKENEGTINGLEIDSGKGCVAPSVWKLSRTAPTRRWPVPCSFTRRLTLWRSPSSTPSWSTTWLTSTRSPNRSDSLA